MPVRGQYHSASLLIHDHIFYGLLGKKIGHHIAPYASVKLQISFMRRDQPFKIQAPFSPKGDQPQAIQKLVQGARDGLAHQVLLGATGTGKTYTAAQVIQELQRPALVIAHNKTLAAQLCQELREFFPDNAVEYFVSYYDYYQPEAYVVHSDTYIEKESSRNDEIDRLRHSSTQSLTSRRDVIVVSSVSCIYGLGTPELYKEFSMSLRVGDTIDRRKTLEQLISMQFARNDVNLVRGTFRVRGDVLEVHPRDSDNIIRVDTFGDEIEAIQEVNQITGDVVRNHKFYTLFPATHFIASEDRMGAALEQMEIDLEEQCRYFESVGKLLEAQRLRQRVRYDMEMMREVGYCNGIENYSRYLDGRKPGEAPYTLIDYFPKDFLLMIDESHVTLPQIRAMYNGDRARKETLVDYGFRLPVAYDNRPLKFEEFEERMGQTTYISATPGPYEFEHIGLQKREAEPAEGAKTKKPGKMIFDIPEGDYIGLAQQIIRPTGLLDPEISIRPTRGQIDDLLGEINDRVARKERVLCTTLTKRMAEDLTDYLKEIDVKVNYLHSDVETMERSQILRELRQGKYDVVVGINLLREGLDLPEVSLVAILDADKEGFLRSDTSLIQTIGRAARHVNGQVVMYADRITGSMQRAIDETNRRRALQIAFNEANGITPQGIQKAIREDLINELLADVTSEMKPGKIAKKPKMEDLPKILEELESEMKAASAALDFERAAQLRDELLTLRELAKGT
jgi:excinuclease ABC subunit B